MNVFVNMTNHPSESWSKPQLEAAREYGAVIDYPFPVVEADSSPELIWEKAREIAADIKTIQPKAVLVQGEFTLTHALVQLLQEVGILCLAACSERCTISTVNEAGETIRKSVFRFVRFRSYEENEK